MAWAIATITFLLVYWTWKFFKSPTMDIDPRDKPVFVTGAASGIGKAVVELLAAKGCYVFAADVNLTKLEEHFGQVKNVMCLKVDVTSEEDTQRAKEAVKKVGKGLFAVVNCAGIGSTHPVHVKSCIEEDVEKEVRPVIEINLLGTMRINHAFLDEILESKGCILNTASIFGRFAPGGAGAYVASKHAVNGYTAALRREIMHTGVRVIAAEPGGVFTPMITTSALYLDPDFSQTKIMNTENHKRRGEKVRQLSRGGKMQSPERVAGMN